jgi:glycosyltransferase involved in cell wall biosynthesis
MKIALIHDWLTGFRGGEQVLLSLCRLYPDATLFTLVHRPGSQPREIEQMEIRTSFAQKLPLALRYYRQYLPLLPAAIERLDLRGYDLVISSSHCVAKGVLPPAGTPHVCYCHTPMRYVWDMYHDYFGPHRLGMFSRLVVPHITSYLRLWDRLSSDRVDRFAANSENVARRIGQRYRRQATVIHPPVDVETFSPASGTASNGGTGPGYFLLVSALSPYKHVELAIEAFNRSGAELRIVGFGPELRRLRRLAGPGIRFLGTLALEELVEQYRHCRAFVYPAEEDFGLALVEAQACGRPVVALGRGGALESVIDGKTGALFHEPSAEALNSAVDRLEGLQLNVSEIRENALRFSHRSFEEKMARFVEGCCTGNHQTGSENAELTERR